jgi:hypothetical protein
MYLYVNNLLEPFYFLTFKYAAAYTSIISPPLKYISNFRPIFWNSFVHWTIFFAVIRVLSLSKWSKKIAENASEALFLRVYLLLFFVCSFACVCPGGYFRSHYFQLMFPVSSLLIGVGVSRCTFFWIKTSQKLHLTPLKLQIIALFAFAIAQFGYLFAWTPDKIALKMYDSSFKEMKEIGLMLSKQTQPTDKIAILGSEPQIFFYANRVAASGFLYHFPLIEAQKYAAAMSQQFTSEVEKAHPTIFIYNHQLTFNGYNQLTYNYLQQWRIDFCKDYEIIGRVYRDFSKPYSESDLRWKHLNQDISSDSLVMVDIFKRK